jgi:hypothetical protein
LPLTAAQIINLACTAAKTPGMIVQAGQFLNVILEELAQINDLEVNRGLWTVNTGAPSGYSATSTVPYYNLAPDHLRVLSDECFYLVSGVPYTLIQKQLSEFDQLITTTGFNSQMLFYAVDDSTSPSQILFWPPPNASYSVFIRYEKLTADMANPETSASVPRFPLQQYLIWELTARMMDISDDDRVDKFHEKARNLFRKWIVMQRDLESTVLRVKLDRNRFGVNTSSLKNTKAVGF